MTGLLGPAGPVLTPEELRQLRLAVSSSQTVGSLRHGDAIIRRLLATIDACDEAYDLAGAALSATTGAGDLDAAWKEAEAGLPEGATLAVSSTRGVSGPFVATTDYGEPRHGFAYAATPALALRALAAKLRKQTDGV